MCYTQSSALDSPNTTEFTGSYIYSLYCHPEPAKVNGNVTVRQAHGKENKVRNHAGACRHSEHYHHPFSISFLGLKEMHLYGSFPAYRGAVCSRVM